MSAPVTAKRSARPQIMITYDNKICKKKEAGACLWGNDSTRKREALRNAGNLTAVTSDVSGLDKRSSQSVRRWLTVRKGSSCDVCQITQKYQKRG